MTAQTRLSLALESGHVALPDAGRIAVFAPRVGYDLTALPTERCNVITGFRPDYDYFAGLGLHCGVKPEGRYGASIVFLPRSKVHAQALIAQATRVTDGLVIVDGAKSDGIESMLKGCRRKAEVTAPLSKAHGKLFSFAAGDGFDDWIEKEPQEIAPGFVTVAGVFSADGIDPASKLLVECLPKSLGKSVADLGAGWGYLSKAALERADIETLYMVEANHAALGCARLNVADARARMVWEDASRWRPDHLLDCVITNPPFHVGRSADPDIGRAFIRSAAEMLGPQGHLWLVANRHLPYEAEMMSYFARVEEKGGDNRFKILMGHRPKRARR